MWRLSAVDLGKVDIEAVVRLLCLLYRVVFSVHLYLVSSCY